MFVGKLEGYLRLMRPVNCLMMGFTVVVGGALASPSGLMSQWVSVALGFATGFMLTAASMTINDYYDRRIDALNEPKRPIPSGMVKPRSALILASILTAGGLVSAYLTNESCLLTAIVAWIVFTAYTIIGKRSGLPGNLLVSVCVSIPFVYGSVAVLSSISPNVLLFVLLIFLSNMGREITKGIVDVQGDKKQNVKTIAVRYGERKAAVAAVAFYLSAVSLSLLPWATSIVSVYFLPFVAITDAGLIVSSHMLLRNHSRESARRVKNSILLWFMFGLLSFTAGAIH